MLSRTACSGTVYLVGAGPGSPDLITVRGLKLLREADVVVYDALVHHDLLAEIRGDAERVYAGKRGYCVGSTLQETIFDVLVNRARQGLRVVRLKCGDPCVFGRGGEEAEYLAEHGVAFELVPGVTTAVGACAAASIPLTHRDAGQSVALVTGHFDPDSPECTLDWPALARMSTLVVYMGLRHLDKIAARLIEALRARGTAGACIVVTTASVRDATFLADQLGMLTQGVFTHLPAALAHVGVTGAKLRVVVAANSAAEVAPFVAALAEESAIASVDTAVFSAKRVLHAAVSVVVSGPDLLDVARAIGAAAARTRAKVEAIESAVLPLEAIRTRVAAPRPGMLLSRPPPPSPASVANPASIPPAPRLPEVPPSLPPGAGAE